MKINQIVNLIQQKHQDNGFEINAPAKLSDIANFETQMGFSLPTDFKEFYLTCNGFGCNEDIFNMIPLSEIMQENRNNADNWFYIAEYMVYSDMWGVRIESNGEYEIFIDEHKDKPLTSSLSEFLQRFLKGNVFDKGGLYDWQNELGII
ncbi:SMI1/KNR4 family protein [Pedobacter sp.]|uniref:SMI1/KNR4 family protein n=1 Tax=Pedobacter sp. TaxID=1411316 RepID=UPI0031DD142B